MSLPGSARAVDPRRITLERFVTGGSGFYTVEAIGLIVLKLLCLAFAGLLMWAPVVFWDQEGVGAGIFLGAIFIPMGLLVGWMGLSFGNDMITERLNPANRFSRLPRPNRRTPRTAPDLDPRSGPGVRRPRIWTVLLLVLSTPALAVLVHIFSAYAERFIQGRPFMWQSWGYTGIALEPLSFMAQRWLIPVLIVVVISLLALIVLLWRPVPAVGRRILARHRAHPAARQERGTDSVLPQLPEQVLRSSPRGHVGLFLRAGIFLLLGLPFVFFIAYILLAYAGELMEMVASPRMFHWRWDAPQHFGEFGKWYFSWESTSAARVRAVPTALSLCLLGVGIALLPLCVPLLIRRGTNAIDMAITQEGIMVRGGLLIRWDEIAEVLIIRDIRLGQWNEKEQEFDRPPRFSMSLRYIAKHSRTHIALVLRDFPEVADRATRAFDPQWRALRADPARSYGYAFCDLWTHSPAAVRVSLASLKAGAVSNRIPVTALKRTSDGLNPKKPKKPKQPKQPKRS